MSTAALRDEIRRLRDENATLKFQNQRLEFEKIQQNQKLEAAEAARKLLEDQVQALFQQVAAGRGESEQGRTVAVSVIHNFEEKEVARQLLGKQCQLDYNLEDVDSEKTIVSEHPTLTAQRTKCSTSKAKKKTDAIIPPKPKPRSVSTTSTIKSTTLNEPLLLDHTRSRTDVMDQSALDEMDIDDFISIEEDIRDSNETEVPWNDPAEDRNFEPGDSTIPTWIFRGCQTKQTARKSSGGSPPGRYIGYGIAQDDDPVKQAFLSKLCSRGYIKVKAEAVALDPDFLYARIHHLGSPIFPITASPDLISQYVRREGISEKFGGASQGLIQRPQQSFIRAHGYTHFLCPQLDSNPHAPQVAGAHGLIFRAGLEDGIVDNEEERKAKGAAPHKVIVGIASGHWLYTGEYELERSEPLTAAQWSSFSRRIRDAWSQTIYTAKTGIKAEVRATVAFRKHHNREPTHDECRNLVKNRGEIWEGVARGDIMSAYESGEERIVPWVMKCVGYDEDFQRKLLDDQTYRKAPKRTADSMTGGVESNTKKRRLEALAKFLF